MNDKTKSDEIFNVDSKRNTNVNDYENLILKLRDIKKRLDFFKTIFYLNKLFLGKTKLKSKSNSLKKQPFILYLISSVSFLLIFLRLISLQLINYDSFKKCLIKIGLDL